MEDIISYPQTTNGGLPRPNTPCGQKSDPCYSRRWFKAKHLNIVSGISASGKPDVSEYMQRWSRLEAADLLQKYNEKMVESAAEYQRVQRRNHRPTAIPLTEATGGGGRIAAEKAVSALCSS